MGEWTKCTIEQVCNKIYSGGTPSTKHPEYWGGDINWLSSGETSQRYICDTDRKITELGVKNSSTKRALAGTTVIASAGQGYTRGQASYLTIDTYLNQSLIACEPNQEIVDPLFLYYNLDSRYDEFRLLTDGTSTRGGLSGWIVKRMEIYIPDIDEQRKIASILSALDRKIMVNEEINKNLEEQIAALCDSWFDNGSRFGGTLPGNWALRKLSEIADFYSGYSYKGKDLQESSVAMATIKNFDRTGGFKIEGYKEIMPSKGPKETQFAELFDVLVAHTDLTQNAEIIGNAEPILSLGGYDNVIYSMDLVKVTSKDPQVSNFLIAGLLKSEKFKNHCFGYMNGTTVLHLSKKALPEYTLMLPNDMSELAQLNDILASYYMAIANNIAQNESLKRLQDGLLPRLMSGELDLSEVAI